MAAADEPLAGSAADDRAFLLVEYPGPWGRKALEDSRLSEKVRAGLAKRAERAGVRVQLIRRHRRPATGLHVFLGYAVPPEPWVESTVLSQPEELLELDLDALSAGRPAGLDRHDEPLLLVCTNGRRDACCAELGRPLVAAFDVAYPELTWETTHLGGHRFAGALLVLPHGLAYGRLDADAGLEVAARTLEGRLDPAHLRGRTAYPGPVQAAEVALLERLGEDAIDALSLVVAESDGALTRVTLRSATGEHTLVVEAVTGPPVQQSCGDLKVKPTVSYRVR